MHRQMADMMKAMGKGKGMFGKMAGMMGMPPGMPPGVPSYWMPYFQVADCDASNAKAQQLGASVLAGPQDIENTGRFVALKDPQGAVFALFQFKGA
jgi:predicted enzyme related to lactoylglutathione lyase